MKHKYADRIADLKLVMDNAEKLELTMTEVLAHTRYWVMREIHYRRLLRTSKRVAMYDYKLAEDYNAYSFRLELQNLK